MLPLSIITINYNNAEGLSKTIQSVTNQRFKNFEYIIIDGGSTDGSIDVIKSNSDFLSYWVSEEDSGIYHAMNKGIKVAKGEYLLFLNSGDILYNNEVLNEVNPHLNHYDILYGNLKNSNGKELNFPDSLTFDYFRNSYLPHPSTFIRRNVLIESGLYNEELKIMSDWAFFAIAICKHGATYKHLDQVISVFNANGISSDVKSIELMKDEKEKIINEEFSLFKSDYQQLDKYRLLQFSRLFKGLKKAGFFKFTEASSFR